MDASSRPRRVKTDALSRSRRAQMNPFLTVITSGLAMLTLTSFSVKAIKDALPPIARVGCPVAASVSLGASQSVAMEVSRRQVIADAMDAVSSTRPMRNL
jgi:hypothetical protein